MKWSRIYNELEGQVSFSHLNLLKTTETND